MKEGTECFSCDRVVNEKLQYSSTDVLGKGNVTVYKGIFRDKTEQQGRVVAVKKVGLHSSVFNERETSLHQNLEHENVLQFLGLVDYKEFRYIVLELCVATLDQVIENSVEIPVLPEIDVLKSIASGLNYIHSRNLVHRDIKPSNILISQQGIIKISDFGSMKMLNSNQFCSVSGTRGTLFWIAPELEVVEDQVLVATAASDTFSAGCVFFVYCTRNQRKGGIHPYGNTDSFKEIPLNIKQGKAVNRTALHRLHIAVPIILEMIRKDPTKRITMKGVLDELEKKNEPQPKPLPFITETPFNNETLSVTSIRFHPTEPILACGSEAGRMQLLNHSTSVKEWTIEQFLTEFVILHFEWNVDGNQLCSITKNDNRLTVCVYCYPSGEKKFEHVLLKSDECVTVWNPYDPNVFALYCLKNKDTKKTSRNNVSCIINVEKQRTSKVITKARIRRIEWISKTEFASVCEEGVIRIHQVNESAAVAVVDCLQPEQKEKKLRKYPLRWCDEFKLLAWATQNSIKISTVEGVKIGSTKEILEIPDDSCTSLAWCKKKDSPLLACGLLDGKISICHLRLYATPSQIDLHGHIELYGHWDGVWQISFSNDGKFLASADKNDLIIWNTEKWDETYVLRLLQPNKSSKRPKISLSIMWHTTSNKLAICDRTNQVKLIEYKNNV